MKLSHVDQVFFARLALEMLDDHKANAKDIEIILGFGELMKKYTDEDNSIIFDVTEYLYEQLRLLRNDKDAYDNKELRNQLEHEINSHERQ